MNNSLNLVVVIKNIINILLLFLFLEDVNKFILLAMFVQQFEQKLFGLYTNESVSRVITRIIIFSTQIKHERRKNISVFLTLLQ